MQIELRKIRDLKPYEKNPRKNKDAIDYVANSIREFGFKVPIVIDGDGVIVAGHTRYEASKRLKLKEVPCIVADDLSEEQIKAYRLADNKTAEFAEWDLDLLSDELDGIIDIDMTGFGFDLDEDEPQKEIVEDDIPEPTETRCSLGDVWKLGNHRLICGDSTDPHVYEKLMNGEKPDIVFTDPPYGMNLNTDYSDMVNHLDFAKDKGFERGHKYEQGIVDDFHPEMISAILATDANEMFLWGGDYFAELLPDRNEGSWIVWDKRSNGNDDIDADYSSDRMYGSCFELCWSKKKHKRDIARVKWAGVFGTEQEFDHKRYHPTQKPIKLAEWFLTRYGDKGDYVLDLFGGSGCTLIACEQLDRICYMAELDPYYCDVIIQRWENLTGGKAELLTE